MNSVISNIAVTYSNSIVFLPCSCLMKVPAMEKKLVSLVYPQILVFLLIKSLLLLDSVVAEPRAKTVEVTCGHQLEHNTTIFVPNFIATMEKISQQMRSTGYGTAVTGTGPDIDYGLAQCYGDLSLLDCVLCYAEARTVLPKCFPNNGGRIFLDGCFMRSENYSFFDEYAGPGDKAVCGNKTRKNSSFQAAAKQAVLEVVQAAPNSKGYYARGKVDVSGRVNESAYVLANCWKSLNSSSCKVCLENASKSVLKCLPSSEGRALNTGCFMRYSDTDFLNKEQNNGRSRGTLIVIVVAVVSAVIVLVVGIAIGVYIRKDRYIQRKRRGSNDAEKLAKTLHRNSLNFKYSTLEKATNSFNEANKLGQGGFGSVYRGVLPDGREIAIKRLYFNNRHRAADFYNEVNIISSVEHKNLVRLLGCSCSGPESLLVYEFLPNKSLDQFIFDRVKGRELNWEKRYDIIIGTAEGLVYLHENSKTRIIHRDIKASNILLDAKLRAKIADFGLARSFQEDKSHISTAIAGTLGYMAPEYLAHGQLTEKADVYSFGVLVLEIVTGRQNNRSKSTEYSDSIVILTWRHFQSGTAEELFDPNLASDDNNNVNKKDEILRVVHIGLLCTQENPSLRPTMSRALQMLTKKEENLARPSNPPFTDENTMELNDTVDNPFCPLNNATYSSEATMSHSSFYAR
ncbi:cysteine-rich receptor-like protein kinase 2 isoform X1 [Arachis duranensis]|uniref:Cysteine-rich receptor-like protein kinase 2 isoform X1 n=2 Tax=Arachis duranensis TaxID=130453 RepID=A0A6P4CVW0_ARADU|nr:cysteine-rich receptor-like protein kinase 2 isoform X1 [Arachis duranensis]XP_025690503.1 cysteine-rich receptor-like protein kinase 2 isoform X1 [Arachis hypogaea]